VAENKQEKTTIATTNAASAKAVAIATPAGTASAPTPAPSAPPPKKDTRYYKLRCFKCERDYKQVPITYVTFAFGGTRNHISMCLQCLLGAEIAAHPIFATIKERMGQPKIADRIRAARQQQINANAGDDADVASDVIPIGMWPVTKVSKYLNVSVESTMKLILQNQIKVMKFENQDCIPRKFVEKLKQDIESALIKK
jgi:hypothetical protein